MTALLQGKSSSGVQLTSGGVTNQETGKVFNFLTISLTAFLMTLHENAGDRKSGSEKGAVHPWWGNHGHLKVEH